MALLEHLSRLGIGISSFASVGDKLDVSGNDLLQWWAQDGITRLAVLYLESFGNPRKFARTAARVSATMPVLTVHAGRSAPGQRAAASHTAAAAAPLITRQALFEQAGIIATTSFGELLEAAVLLASQPVPAGSRVCIISNAGGAGVLAADACVEAGLAVATLSHAGPGPAGGHPAGRRRARRPGGHDRGGQRRGVRRRPGRGGRRRRRGRGHRAGRPDRGRRPDPGAPRGPAARARWPPCCWTSRTRSSCCRLPGDGPDGLGVSRVRLPGERGPGARPGRAVRLMAVPARGHGPGARRASGRRGPRADRLVPGPGPRRRLAAAGEADRLLRCYGLPMVASRLAVTADEAAAAAADLGGRVALKAEVSGLVHKSDAGGGPA